MKMQHKVHKARKTKDGQQWKVVVMPNQEEHPRPEEGKKPEREVHYFDILVCCSGQHQVPRQTHLEAPFTNFTGTSVRTQVRSRARTHANLALTRCVQVR
jgi:hypothetical protein